MLLVYPQPRRLIVGKVQSWSLPQRVYGTPDAEAGETAIDRFQLTKIANRQGYEYICWLICSLMPTFVITLILKEGFRCLHSLKSSVKLPGLH